jgi:hypothetical protein
VHFAVTLALLHFLSNGAQGYTGMCTSAHACIC